MRQKTLAVTVSPSTILTRLFTFLQRKGVEVLKFRHVGDDVFMEVKTRLGPEQLEKLAAKYRGVVATYAHS